MPKAFWAPRQVFDHFRPDRLAILVYFSHKCLALQLHPSWRHRTSDRTREACGLLLRIPHLLLHVLFYRRISCELLRHGAEPLVVGWTFLQVRTLRLHLITLQRLRLHLLPQQLLRPRLLPPQLQIWVARGVGHPLAPFPQLLLIRFAIQDLIPGLLCPVETWVRGSILLILLIIKLGDLGNIVRVVHDLAILGIHRGIL
mmetsp:Transcript_77200/g.173220  ORF Transcript_77200/g.173220 Transcript_77200/m.173220 type:complete len:200 (-) Transcript_77200:357-956(-)